jgi:dihydroorotase
MESSSARTAQKTLARQKKRADQGQNLKDQNLLVEDANIWTGNGFIRGSILIENGKVQRIARRLNVRSTETIDASGLCALPGLVDVHVHLRDMRLSYKEDFATGTAAAAAGGFTTVLDMPNTLPPTDTPERLEEKQRKAARRVHVNVGFHAAATSSSKTMLGLVRAGAFSLKLYMPKPIAPLNVKDDEEVRKMMTGANRAGIPITVHAEDVEVSTEKTQVKDFQQLSNVRPPLSETRAVERISRLQSITGAKVHLCHLTLASSLQRGVAEPTRITSEVTPHHLLLSRSMLGRVGWRAWMVPPLRSEIDRQALLTATRSGSSDVLASDHAPHAIKEKQRKPANSPPGIPGLETTLPLMLTLVSKRILNISRLVSLLADNPARIFHLGSKAKLRRGYDGDVTLVDLKKKTRIDSAKFLSKAKYSPFDGFKTTGGVVSTIVGGKLVYHQGELVGKEGCGSILRSSVLG